MSFWVLSIISCVNMALKYGTVAAKTMRWALKDIFSTWWETIIFEKEMRKFFVIKVSVPLTWHRTVCPCVVCPQLQKNSVKTDRLDGIQSIHFQWTMTWKMVLWWANVVCWDSTLYIDQLTPPFSGETGTNNLLSDNSPKVVYWIIGKQRPTHSCRNTFVIVHKVNER